MPTEPEVPPLPYLNMAFEDGKYIIDEQSVDNLIIYGETTLPTFINDYSVYRKQMQIVKDALISYSKGE